MDDAQTLELQLKTTVQNAIGKMDELINKLSKVDSVTTKTKTSVDKFSKAFASLGTYAGVKKLTSQMLQWMNLSIDFTEQLNLFNVVFGNIQKNGVKTFSALGKEATQFQSRMNEAFGTNKTETLKYQALFQSMGENVGIPDNYSAVMSETMTKLTYDLASLYNKSESTTGEALRAGVYAGQTKPLRSFGIDVTQTSMQPILDSLGITDRSIKQMSQAEKEILRYLATLNQAKIAMGDMTNTIESPSNQLKIFKQQLIEAKVALTSLFMGGFANILPYANAILMVVKELSRAIASFFGIELTDYNSGIASTEDAYAGIGDSIDDATGKAKKLKREVLGFDQIHNINEKDNSGSGSTDVAGGIDQRLLDAIKGYDNGMDKVRMKATEIRDKIMEWLGFHKKINPLTGEVYFEYQGIDKTLKNVWKSFKGLSAQGKVLVGLGLVVGATKLWNIGKKLVTVLGNSGLGKAVKSLISPSKELFNWTKLGVQVNGDLVSGVRDGIQAWRASNGIINEATGKVQGLSGIMNGATVAIKGLITGAIGLAVVNDSMKNISEEGLNLANTLGLVGGSLGTIISGVQVGAVFGPWGAVIGGATGALLGLVSAIDGYKTETMLAVEANNKAIEKSREFTKQIQDQRNILEEGMEIELKNANVHRDLKNELFGLVDANGKVKDGYEKRAQFILTELSGAYDIEFELVNGQIKKWGELKTTIEQVIDAERTRIILHYKQEEYYNALNNESELRKQLKKDCDKLNESEELLKKANEEYNEALERFVPNVVATQIALNKAKQGVDEAEESFKKAKETYKKTAEEYKTGSSDIMTYEELLVASTNKNYTEIENIMSRTSTETYKKWADTLYQQTKDIDPKEGKIGAKLVAQWTSLGMTNEKEFMAQISKLDPHLQQQIIDKMEDKGYMITSNLKKGLEKNGVKVQVDTEIKQPKNATIKIDADTSKAESKTKSWLQKLANLFPILAVGKATGGSFYGGSWHDIPQYANGGMPSHGSMFIAGERGAEIVGHINGRTEVLNQSQIASAIYSAVVSAMSQFSGQSSQIDVHVHTDEGTIIDRINQKTKQTGICPINI